MKTWHLGGAAGVFAAALSVSCGGSVTGAGGSGTTGTTGTGAGSSTSTTSTTSTGSPTSTSSGIGPTGCPASPPSGSCAGVPSGLGCSYGDSVQTDCRTFVTCVNDSWTAQDQGTCTPADAGVCPATQPGTSASCPTMGVSCVYGDTLCVCDACAGGLCQAPPVRWACAAVSGPASCPPIAPNAGTACSDEGASCTYGFPCGNAGTNAQCTGGAWVWGMTACPG